MLPTLPTVWRIGCAPRNKESDRNECTLSNDKVYRSDFSAITYIQRRIDGVGFGSQNVQGTVGKVAQQSTSETNAEFASRCRITLVIYLGRRRSTLESGRRLRLRRDDAGRPNNAAAANPSANVP